MKTKVLSTILLAVILSLTTVSCERDPEFVKGQYQYENQELTYVNGLLIAWSSNDLSDEIKDAVRDIVASMVFVEGGTFTMGSDNATFPDEQPTHRVTLSDFYLAKVTVTQKQWSAIMGENPLWSENYGKGDNYPANFTSYEQAKLFIERLNEYSGMQFRMPTEAEWEYATCGGKYSQSTSYTFSGSNDVNEVAWHRDNAGGTMHPVAKLKPNELGLHDMSGNVWEWCSDWYGNYPSESLTNPTGPSTGTKRVVRGGSFTYEAVYSRCKTRNCLSETNQSLAVGLRLAVSANEPTKNR